MIVNVVIKCNEIYDVKIYNLISVCLVAVGDDDAAIYIYIIVGHFFIYVVINEAFTLIIIALHNRGNDQNKNSCFFTLASCITLSDASSRRSVEQARLI